MDAIEKARAKAESVGCGLALYALETGAPWALEVMWHGSGEVFRFDGATVAECLSAAGFSEDPEPPVDPFG